MSGAIDVEGLSLTHRVVLLGLADLSGRDATPAHAATVVSACNGTLDAAESRDAVLGRLAEAEAARALNELEASGPVASVRESESPAGKGRPHYRLTVDREAVLDAVADDDRLAPLVDRSGER